ncbi:endolytic transglycosylase MltG [Marinobacter sp. M1N3S26]|uniref:endolytic transglycosylase MltG n=1 Tax=unclassified Marinobacter TaxID=83889 RepID=UPI00387B203D
MIKSFVIAVVASVLVTVAGAALWSWQGLKTLEVEANLQESMLYLVPRGTSYNAVAHDLEQKGLVDKAIWLKLLARVEPEMTAIRAGEYEFHPGMTPRNMIALMVRGDTKVRTVQFIEGKRFRDARAALARAEHLEQLTADWSADRIMAELGDEGAHPEGRLFPDTYAYSRGDSDLEILRRAYEKMNNVLAEEWAGRADDLPYETPYEALIMASIIERETGVPGERRDIAGVFVRRLERGMRLQTDPTVIYGMGDAYEGRITRRDLRTHTPYNTYRISGLPPTPIALPGRAAIHAAVHPAEGDTYYFVARGDGSHKFSRTLEDHRRAVREYQLNRREDYRSWPAPDNGDEGTE